MKKLLLLTLLSCAALCKPLPPKQLPSIKKISTKMDKFDTQIVMTVCDYKNDKISVEDMSNRVEEIAQERMDYLSDQFESSVYRGE